jgi:hypothetical protein
MIRTEPTPLARAIFDSGQSQRAIAKKAAIEESKFSKFVNGWREASDDEKKRIARVLRRTVADLFPANEEAKAS